MVKDFDVKISLCVPSYSEEQALDIIDDVLKCIEDVFNDVEEPYTLEIEEVGEWSEW